MVIITGATGGIGKFLVQKVVSSGMLCCAIIRDINKTNEFILDTNISNLYFANYQYNSFIELLADDDKSKINYVSLVLNAFDISPIKMSAELTKDDITRNIEFNIVRQIETIIKAFNLSQHLGVSLRIVYLDSGAAYSPISGWGLYCAGKAYAGMFLKVFSQENEVPLVLYDPGVVDTKMQETIRNATSHEFPLVDTFRNYQSSSQLNSPKKIAEDIYKRYLINWTAVELCEHFAKIT